MRALVAFMLMATVACASELETLKQQLESIKSEEYAKEELFRGVRITEKWATEGQSSAEARNHIALTAANLVQFWGEDSAEIVKKRLNGMVAVLNGTVKWSGTPEKFKALKQELIEEKQAKIDALLKGPLVPKPTLVRTGVDKLKAVPTRKINDLLPYMEKYVKIQNEELDRETEWKKNAAKELWAYRWEFTGEVTGYRLSDNKDVACLDIKLHTDVKVGGVRYFMFATNVPDTWKRGTTVTVTGFLTYDRDRGPLAGYAPTRSYKEGKKTITSGGFYYMDSSEPLLCYSEELVNAKINIRQAPFITRVLAVEE